MLVNLFYITSIFFIISNLYYIFNRKLLDTRFKNKEDLSGIQLFYYYTRFLYLPWLLIGLFSVFKLYFILLLLVSLLKFPFYHINKKTYVYYIIALPIIDITLLLTTLYVKFL